MQVKEKMKKVILSNIYGGIKTWKKIPGDVGGFFDPQHKKQTNKQFLPKSSPRSPGVF